MLSFIMSLVFYVKNTENRTTSTSGLWLMYCCFFLLLFSYIVALSIFSPAAGTDYFARKLFFFFTIIVFPCLLLLLTPGTGFDTDIISRFFVFTSLILAVKQIWLLFAFGITDYLSAQWLPRLAEGLNPIWLARYLSLGLLVISDDCIKKVKLHRLTIIAVIILGIVLTGSKAGLFYSVFGIGLLVIKELVEQKKVFKAVRSVAVVTFALGVVFVFFSHMNPVAFERRFSFESGTIASRQILMNRVYNSWKESNTCLTGRGFATVGEPIEGTFTRSYPHNVTVELLYELGLLGMLIYYLPFVVFLFHDRKFLSKELFPYVVLVFVFLLHAQTSGDLMANGVPFLLLAFLVGQHSVNPAKADKVMKRMGNCLFERRLN
jgi:hypothetical protein